MMSQPLAERLRPKTLDDYIGQKHLVGQGAVLRKMIDAGRVPSFILWGPPGVGKTTLAQIIANKLDAPFYTLSAISSGVKDVREVIEKAKSNRFFNTVSPILFIDEIHRFSKSQQDSLLNAVETGVVTLIGATTENPSFEVIRPLLSRCQVYVLKSLDKNDLLTLLHKAIAEDVVLKDKTIRLTETDAMLRYSGGDARKLLNILELVVSAEESDDIEILDEKVVERLQENPAAYDKGGEMHYDIISAFIKSIRGSDPDGAIYWLARMVAGGEDPEFIARRLVISASEDIGLANPNALLLANACFDALKKIGWPEGRIILATFASNVHRIQQVVDAASRYNRKVAIVGRSMVNVVGIAQELNYLRIPEDTIIDIDEIGRYPKNRIVVICTGSQGEPLSALARIANGEHKTIEIEEGDTVIISATPVPGNEKAVTRVINQLAKIGADVYDKSRARVHVSGHAGAEELKIMLSIVKPKNFMPVHGEATHLRAHAKLAEATGVDPDNIYVLENGDSLELSARGVERGEGVPSGIVYVDGLSVGDTSQDVLDERNTLGNQGFASVAAAVNMKDRKLVGQVQVSMHGITGGDDYYLAHEAENTVANALRKCLSKDGGVKELRKAASKSQELFSERQKLFSRAGGRLQNR